MTRFAMRKRDLGKTGLRVTEMALGTWGLCGDGYGPVDNREQDAVIDRALTFGINLFETADIYGQGAMERKLGQRLPGDGTTYVVTKIGTDMEAEPHRKRFDPEFLEQSFAQSQERLHREKLDVVLLHNPSVETIKRGEATALMQQLVDNDKLTAWGVSAGSSEVIYALLGDGPKPAIVQVAYNAFMTRDFDEVQYDLEEEDIGVLARSVLAHGLLAGYWMPDKEFSTGDHRKDRWTTDQLKRRLNQLKALNTVVGRKIPSKRAAALRYVLDNPRIGSAVLGPRSVMQLTQLVREGSVKTPFIEPHSKGRLESKMYDLGVYR